MCACEQRATVTAALVHLRATTFWRMCDGDTLCALAKSSNLGRRPSVQSLVEPMTSINPSIANPKNTKKR
eukprot:181840-Prymnesium_polylepis.2